MPTILEIISDMLAYEAEQFDAVPTSWYAHGLRMRDGKRVAVTQGPFDDEELAKQIAGEMIDGHVEDEAADLSVSGADLVDAFSEWRTQLKAAMPDVSVYRAYLENASNVARCDEIVEEFLRALGFVDFADLWCIQVGRSTVDPPDDEPCRICGAVPGTSEYGTVGDGFDGMCGNCADKAEVEDEESRPDPWHVGALPGDEHGCTIRDENGLTVRICSSPAAAAGLVELHNAGELTDEL